MGASREADTATPQPRGPSPSRSRPAPAGRCLLALLAALAVGPLDLVATQRGDGVRRARRTRRWARSRGAAAAG